MKPITKHYKKGDKLTADDLNSLIDAINAGLVPELYLTKTQIAEIVYKLACDLLHLFLVEDKGANVNNIFELENVVTPEFMTQLKESMLFKITLDEELDTFSIDELHTLIDRLCETMPFLEEMLNEPISEENPITIMDMIDKAFNDIVVHLFPIVRNVIGTSSNGAYAITGTFDKSYTPLINNIYPKVKDYINWLEEQLSQEPVTEDGIVDYGKVVPTQVFFDKIMKKHDCEPKDVQVVIFNLTSIVFIAEIVKPILELIFVNMAGGGSSGNTNTTVTSIVEYITKFLSSICNIVIKDTHLLLYADLINPFNNFDYGIELDGTVREEVDPETGNTYYVVENVTKKRGGIRPWGDDSTNYIGMVEIPAKLLINSDIFGDIIDMDALQSNNTTVCLAGKMTIHEQQMDDEYLIKYLSATIELEPKYYANYNMRFDRMKIMENSEEFTINFYRGATSTPVWSISGIKNIINSDSNDDDDNH